MNEQELAAAARDALWFAVMDLEADWCDTHEVATVHLEDVLRLIDALESVERAAD